MPLVRSPLVLAIMATLISLTNTSYAQSGTANSIFSKCSEELASITSQCEEQQKLIVGETLQSVERFLASGSFDQAFKFAQQGIEDISKETAGCLSEIKSLEEKCSEQLLKENALRLRRVFLTASSNTSDLLDAKVEEAISTINNALPEGNLRR